MCVFFCCVNCGGHPSAACGGCPFYKNIIYKKALFNHSSVKNNVSRNITKTHVVSHTWNKTMFYANAVTHRLVTHRSVD